MEKIWNFLKDEDGLETSEYAVMGALIVVALVGTVVLLRQAIEGVFTDMAGVM
jgi:Flp pilus assembly pilin Flp